MNVSPLRKLAIRLACIHAEDRAWIMSQLDSDESLHLSELLQEIDTLGLASDPSVVAAVMTELSTQTAVKPVVDADNQSLLLALGKAEHPLWAALAVQLQEQGKRRKLIDALPNPAAIRRWDSVFASHDVPPALADCMQRYLGQGTSGHE